MQIISMSGEVAVLSLPRVSIPKKVTEGIAGRNKEVKKTNLVLDTDMLT